MKIDVTQDIMAANNAYAEKNRSLFAADGIYAVNILGSPGAGKTSLLEKILSAVTGRLKTAVIEGDLATARDAQRIADCQVPVLQINTNGGCHLDAKMINDVLPAFKLTDIDLMIIENVGNLVCPAAFDLGEDAKLLVMSITEGGDKPGKYPTTFLAADVVILNKIDLLPYIDVDMAALKEEILQINAKAVIFETCAFGEKVSGIEQLADWLAVHSKTKYKKGKVI
jgi:hydrogenase nickel incorporation protein HypB